MLGFTDLGSNCVTLRELDAIVLGIKKIARLIKLEDSEEENYWKADVAHEN